MAYFTKKTWKDRLVEFAGRRTLKNVGTNESVTYDVTRAEGTVSQEGDAFSPANMNDMEQRIADGFSAAEAANNQLSSDIKFPDGAGFYPDIKDGQRGYNTDPARGADTFSPFSSITSVDGNFSAYLPAGGMEAHTVINKPDNVIIKRITFQINRNINGATYIRIITNKNEIPTTVVQYTSVNQPPALNEDISFNIVDDPDSIEIQAQTVSGGSMPQTNITYTVDFF